MPKQFKCSITAAGTIMCVNLYRNQDPWPILLALQTQYGKPLLTRKQANNRAFEAPLNPAKSYQNVLWLAGGLLHHCNHYITLLYGCANDWHGTHGPPGHGPLPSCSHQLGTKASSPTDVGQPENPLYWWQISTTLLGYARWLAAIFQIRLKLGDIVSNKWCVIHVTLTFPTRTRVIYIIFSFW